jgi:fructokinase
MMLDIILSIGEVVWDIFDSRQVLGGAPVNVAYHCSTLGLEVGVVSRVGADALGESTLKQVGALGLPIEGIQRDSAHETGRVIVTIDQRHEPSFEIVDPAAWDFIETEPALQIAGDRPFLLVFGTLAQRHSTSRAAIRVLWSRAQVSFYDVNLRPPFTTRELVLESLAAADIVKMNENEVAVVSGWAGIDNPDMAQAAGALRRQYGLTAMVVTEGGAGAWLVSRDGYCKHPGFAVEVTDTVGAGDAFFAAFIEGYLRKRSWPECLARANHRGAFVASRQGATPPMHAYAYDP